MRKSALLEVGAFTRWTSPSARMRHTIHTYIHVYYTIFCPLITAAPFFMHNFSPFLLLKTVEESVMHFCLYDAFTMYDQKRFSSCMTCKRGSGWKCTKVTAAKKADFVHSLEYDPSDSEEEELRKEGVRRPITSRIEILSEFSFGKNLKTSTLSDVLRNPFQMFGIGPNACLAFTSLPPMIKEKKTPFSLFLSLSLPLF